MSQEDLFESYRSRVAKIFSEASGTLDLQHFVELLLYMSEGAEMNLSVLSVPREVIASTRKLYREAAHTAIDETAIEILERALKDL